MKIEIDIPEEELKEAVLNVVAKRYYSDYSEDRRRTDRIVAEQVRKIIYEDKDRIIDRIVEQASRGCRSKAIKKILDKAGEQK